MYFNTKKESLCLKVRKSAIYFYLTSNCFPRSRTEKNINLFRKFTYLIYILIVYFIVSDGAAVRPFSALPHSQQEYQLFNNIHFIVNQRLLNVRLTSGNIVLRIFLALYSVIRDVQEFKLLYGIFQGFGSALSPDHNCSNCGSGDSVLLTTN